MSATESMIRREPTPLAESGEGRPSAATAYVYENYTLAGAHEAMEGLYEAGLVDLSKMRELDESCLVAVEALEIPDIAALRKREDVTPAVFARYLGVSLRTLDDWEQARSRPDGPALRLLSLVHQHGLTHIR